MVKLSPEHKIKVNNARTIAADFSAQHPRMRPTAVRAIPVGREVEIAAIHEMDLTGLADSVEGVRPEELNSRHTLSVLVLPADAIVPLIQQLQACQSALSAQGRPDIIGGKPRLVNADGTQFVGSKP